MKTRTLLAALVLAALSELTQAAPYFLSQDGSMFWDKATGLVWMRCSLGQKWDGQTCTGQTSTFKFDAAPFEVVRLNAGGGFGGYADWKVPTIRELLSLRYCSAGEGSGRIDLKDGKAALVKECNGGSSRSAVDAFVMPTTTGHFWSSSPYASGSYFAWFVYFGNGGVYGHANNRNNALQVRSVRASQLSEEEAFLTFPVSSEAVVRKAQEEREAAERKAQEEREVAERKIEEERDASERKVQAEREAAARKAQKEQETAARKAREEQETQDRVDKANRAAAIKELMERRAQQLYLEAVEVERNGQNSYASGLYELIIDNFPTSEYAIKSINQLNALKRHSDTESAISHRKFQGGQ